MDSGPSHYYAEHSQYGAGSYGQATVQQAGYSMPESYAGGGAGASMVEAYMNMEGPTPSPAGPTTPNYAPPAQHHHPNTPATPQQQPLPPNLPPQR